MILALLLFLGAIVLSIAVYVGWRIAEDRQDDALDAFYRRLEARSNPEAYGPWLAELDAAGPDREG